jgi:hypothetical protein
MSTISRDRKPPQNGTATMESSRYWEKDANLAPFVDQVLDAGQQTANFVTTKGLTSRSGCSDKNGLRLDRREAVE